MVTVSLLDFIRSGRFGPIALGQTRDDLRRHLGEPDAMGGTSRRHRTPAVWKYGDFEFHFDRDSGWLQLIFIDHFEIPRGGATLAIDPWIIRRDLPMEVLQAELSALDIAYKQDCNEITGARFLRSSAGVDLSYHPVEIGDPDGDEIVDPRAQELGSLSKGDGSIP